MRERKKHYLPTALLAVLFWGLWIGLIGWVDPAIVMSLPAGSTYFPFFVFLFMALFLTGALIMGHSRRALLTSLGVVLFLGLRLKGLGHWVNALLLIGVLATIEIYWTYYR